MKEECQKVDNEKLKLERLKVMINRIEDKIFLFSDYGNNGNDEMTID